MRLLLAIVLVITLVGCSSSPPSSRPLKVAFIGDSYTSGDPLGWPTLMATELNLEFDGGVGTLEAVGGTGFVHTTTPGTFPFGERVDRVVSAEPDVVIVAGGINDYEEDPAEIHQAASELFTHLRTRLPEAIVIVVGPFSPTGGDAKREADRDAIFEAATAEGITSLIDPLPWFDAGGIDLGEDGVHPSRLGHAQIADRMISSVRELLPQAD